MLLLSETKKRIRVKRLSVTEHNCTRALHSRNRKLLMRSYEGIGRDIGFGKPAYMHTYSCLKSVTLTLLKGKCEHLYCLTYCAVALTQTGALLCCLCLPGDVLFLDKWS